MKYFYKILTVILISYFTICAQEGWINQNPFPPQALYFTDLIAFNDSSMLAVGLYGNMIKTTNDGKSWKAINCIDGTRDYSLNFSFIDSVNGWYLSHIEEKVFRTSDGGNSWERLNILNSPPANKIQFVNSQIGFIVGYDGLFLKSTDGGIVWNSHSFDPSFILKDLFFVNQDTGWIVGSQYVSNVSDSALILKTIDGGLNWTVQLKGIVGEYGTYLDCIQFVDASTGFVCGDMDTFLKTTNAGTDWIHYNVTLKSIYFINSNVGWGLTNDNKIEKTLNGGEVWFQQYSGDGGDINSLDFPDENNGWAVGEDGMILKTTDGGDSWTDIRKGTVEQLNSLSIVDENNAWVVGANSTILNTFNGGNEWNYQFIDTTIILKSVQFTDQNNGWIVGENGFIFHTSKGGREWNEQVSQTSSDLRSVFFINDQKGWIAGENGIVLNTMNGGDSWVIKQVGWTSLENLNCVDFVNKDTGWVCGGRTVSIWYGTLYKTIDGGLNWTSIEEIQNNMNPVFDIYFYGDNFGWLISKPGSRYHNYACTTDGGLTWSYELLPYHMEKIFFLNEYVGWIAGEGIIKTTDGGTSWNLLTSFCELPFWLSDVYFVSEEIGWVVGQSGAILKTTDGGITFVEASNEKALPSSMELEQNFPNPFNPSTKIRYSLPISSNVVINVFDILGNKIETLVNSDKPAGTYELDWDAANLPSGIYFYQIKAGDFIQTRKMVLLK